MTVMIFLYVWAGIIPNHSTDPTPVIHAPASLVTNSISQDSLLIEHMVTHSSVQGHLTTDWMQ